MLQYPSSSFSLTHSLSFSSCQLEMFAALEKPHRSQNEKAEIGTAVKNLPANAGDMVSSPGLGSKPWSGKIPHAVEQLSPCGTTTEGHTPRAREPQLARAPRACALQQEKPLQWEARAPQRRPKRKPVHSNEDQVQPKIKNK